MEQLEQNPTMDGGMPEQGFLFSLLQSQSFLKIMPQPTSRLEMLEKH